MKIVVLDGYTINPGDLSWDGLMSLGELTVYPRLPNSDKGAVVEAIGDAEMILTNKTLITADILAACPHIKYIGVLATGYNVVDLEAAKAKGIPVTNIPAYSTDAVAQFVFALLLEICHRAGHHDRAVKEGAWTSSTDFCFWDHPQTELSGKTMGVIGYGRIGKKTAQIAKAFGMRVIVNTPHPDASGSDAAEYVSRDELFARADVVSLHCPLTPETIGMIDDAAISKMKDGVIIVNASRGPLVAEKDLAAALNTGKVCAAAVDVVSAEPISADNPLLTAENCIITPHIAWASIESRRRLIGIAVDNIASFLAGKPVNVVNW